MLLFCPYNCNRDVEFAGQIVKRVNIGDYIEGKVPSLKTFQSSESSGEYNIPSLAALSTSMRLLQRYGFFSYKETGSKSS